MRQQSAIPDRDHLAELDATLQQLESLGRSMAAGGRVAQAQELEAAAARYRLLAVPHSVQDESLPLALLAAEQLPLFLELQRTHGTMDQRLREVEYQLDSMHQARTSASLPHVAEAAYYLRTRAQHLLEALADLRRVLHASAP